MPHEVALKDNYVLACVKRTSVDLNNDVLLKLYGKTNIGIWKYYIGPTLFVR